jgi:hypothetical protein
MQELLMSVSLVRVRSSQLPLFGQPHDNPRWSALSFDVQQKILRLLTQLLRQHRGMSVTGMAEEAGNE